MNRLARLLTSVLSTGRAVPFAPTSISGLLVWLDFSDLTTLHQTNDTSTPVTADGQTVGYAADKSGSGNHYVQATALQRPLWKANIQNSLGVLRLDTANKTLRRAGITSADITVFCVWRSAETGAKYILSFGSTNNSIIQGYTTGKIEWYNTPRTVIADIDAVNFQNVYTIVGSGSNAGEWTVGGLTANVTGDCGELIVYNSELSVANQEAVSAYLTAKWDVGF